MEVEFGSFLIIFSEGLLGLFHEILAVLHGLGGLSGHSLGCYFHFYQSVFHGGGLLFGLLTSHAMFVWYKR